MGFVQVENAGVKAAHNMEEKKMEGHMKVAKIKDGSYNGSLPTLTFINAKILIH